MSVNPASFSTGVVDDGSLGALFGRLADDGKRFVRAEVDVQVATAKAKAGAALTPIILLVVALMMAQAALTTFFVGVVLALVAPLGPLGAGIVGAVIAFAVAGVLALVAKSRLAAIGRAGT